MRLSRLRVLAVSLAAVLVLVVGTAGQAFACVAPEPDDNLHLESAVSVPAMAPSTSLTLAVDRQSANPGQALTYTALVTNSGTTLTLTGSIEVTNTHRNPVSLAAWYDYVSFDPKGHCSSDDNDNDGHNSTHWTPIAGAAGAKTGYTASGKAPISTGETFTATSVPSDGVKYSTGSDTISGTSIGRGATARWTFTAVIPLTSSQAAALFKGNTAYPIRASFHAEGPTGNSHDSDAATISNAPFCRQLTALKGSGSATDMRVAFTLPDATVRTVSKTTVPALGAIAPGTSVQVKTSYTVPVPAPKGAGETDAAYIARLTALDGTTLSASATARSGASGPIVAAAGPVHTTETLPILSLTKEGPASVEAGATASYNLRLGNTSSAPASSILLTDSLPAGTTIPVTGTPATLAPGATATAHASYPVPADQPAGDLTDTAKLRWTDAAGNWYGPISSNATSTVTRSIATVIVTASGGTLTYGGTIPAITPSYSGWQNGDGPSVLTTAPTCTTTATDASGAGTYKTTCTGAAAPNYTFVYVDGSVAIARALLTITAPSGSMAYGGTVPSIAPSYSGWVKGEGPSALTTAPTCSTAATSASGVGTYKASCSGAAAANYTFAYVDGSVKVTPALVTLTASSDSMTYGGTVPAITPSYAGWQNGEGPSVLTTAPTCTTAATSASPAGTYGSSCSGALAANYTFAYVDGKLSVNPSTVIVTASSGSLTYGAGVPAITPAYSGWLNGDGPSVLTTPPVCTTTAASTSGVGTYKTTCTGAVAPNYTFTYADGSIVVTPALLTVTAQSGSMTYGGTEPAITPAYSGWQNGDGPAVLTTAPTCATTATSTSAVGTYKTTCAGAAAANYTFAYVDGGVTVTPAVVTVTASSASMPSGGAIPAITPTYSGWQNGDGPGVLTTAPNCTTTATSASPAGAYRSSCTGAVAPNYTFNYVDGTISVEGVISTGLILTPQASGPLPINSSHAFTVTATDSNGQPVSGAAIALNITGPNATSANLTTGADGTVTFTYTGTHAGTDTAQATRPGPNGTLASNTASVSWITPVQTVSTTTVHGRFFANSAGGTFAATPASTPVFAQDFPVIDFNPPADIVSKTFGVSPTTRPFTDVTTDLVGNPTGTIVAAGNGHTAGSGDLNSFDAAFEGAFVVAGPGDVTFHVFAADGFILGVNGASRVAGELVNPPANGLTPFDAYTVVGAHNANGAPTTYTVTLRFPAAGSYEYELDYFQSGGAGMSLALVEGAAGGSGTRTLWYGNDMTGDVVQTDLTGTLLTELAGTPRTGIAFDGTNLYVAARGGTVEVRSADGKTLIKTFAAPPTLAAEAEDLAFDQTRHVLWQVDHDNHIYKRDPSTGEVLGILQVSNVDPGGILTPLGALGLTYDPTRDLLYIGFCQHGCSRLDLGLIESVNPDTGAVVGVVLRTPYATAGLAYVADDDSIWIGALDVKHVSHTGTILAEFPITWPASFLDGLELVGGPTSGTPIGTVVPPAGSLNLAVGSTAGAIGLPASITVAAMDGSGKPAAGVAVSVAVTGANHATLTGTTDAAGLVTLSYTGLNTGTDQLAASATISGAFVVSDVVRIAWSNTGTGGGGSGSTAPPSIGSIGPAEGAIITAPTPVTGSISAPAGDTITGWSVAVSRMGVAGATTIASGAGAPPANLATIDPTLLVNGGYNLTVAATASNGVTLASTTGFTVSGNLKLGRYGVTYQDANVAVGGIPISVTRSYDSFDKSQGSFGVGWQLGVANFRVYTNGALGAGGWSQYATSCFMAGLGGGLCQMAWATARPHLVTVVWPDGHTETFDFTPTGGSNLFWLGNAAFTARAGSTSSLAVVGDGSLSYKGDGNLYGGFPGSTVFAPTRFALTAKDGTAYVLDTVSGLISETDRVGNSVTVDSAGIHSSLGRSITFIRDGSGRTTEMDKPDGTKVTYAYDSAGNLASVTDERNKTVTYHYDADHNLTETLDPDGHPLRTLTYWPDGRLKTVTDGAGNTSTITLDPNARTEIVTGPDPRLTTISSMNPRGDIVQIDQVFGGKTLTTKFTYDDFGHVLSKTDPLGNTTEATYDAAGSPLTLTEPDKGIWTFTYDDHENLTSVTDRTNRQIATLKYDSYGELAKKTTPDGDVIYTYGDDGLLASVTDTLGRLTTYGYDSAGHVTAVTGPDGRIWGYSYDANGKTKTVTNPASEATTFHYDDAGNFAWFKDALGHGQTYSYDNLGRLATVTDALGHDTTYSYNPAGQVETILDRNSVTTRFAYDASGHVTGVTLPGGSALNYTYDPLARLTEADDSDVTLVFTYDDAGNLKSQTSGGTPTSNQPTVSLTFGRDAAGRPTSVIAPWGTTTHAYDGNGLLKTVTDPSSGVFNLGYDPLGRLATLSRPNGVDDLYAYEVTGQLSSRTSSKGAVIDALSYSYDDSGRRTTKTDSAGTTTYGYDTADRLISVLAPAGSSLPNEAFTYDPSGNQTQSGQTYDAANRLLADAKFTYANDLEGNQTSRTERATGKVTTYTWNALHQLTSAHLPAGSVVTYRYDALGRRVEQTSAAGITRYVNLGANVMAEYDGANTLRASYVTTFGSGDLPGVLLDTNVGGTVMYPVTDGVGSVTGTTNSSGALTSFSYTAYGTPVGASSGTYSYGTYGYDSATGLYYARARYYDSVAGVFVGEDPVGLYPNVYGVTAPSLLGATCSTECSGSSMTPALPSASVNSLALVGLPGSGASPYGYGSQNPVNLSDPTGRMPFDEYGARMSNNQVENEVARRMGKEAAKALGCTFTKRIQRALHLAISKKGYTPDEIYDIALQLMERCKK